jgi:hypothetical protein
MRITDYLGTFPEMVREKEWRSLRRSVRTGIKIAFAGTAWFFTWPVAVTFFLNSIKAIDNGFLFLVGMFGWFLILFVLLSLLLWWGENYYLPKRGIWF